jgi:hypothetical protein
VIVEAMGKQGVQGRLRHLLYGDSVQELRLDRHQSKVPELVITLDR